MQHRTSGRTGLSISEISLGTEYLIGKPREVIVQVVRAAIAGGVNYFDLFCAESSFRDAMGEAFKDDRERVYLAAHLGATVTDEGQYKKTRAVSTSERFFDDFLTRYRTDYADVLVLHNCDSQKDFDIVFREDGFLGLALRLKEEGHVRHLGFSGHTVETARQAVEGDLIDILMFPINLTGHAVPGKPDLLRSCAERGVGVVAMKPYSGGKLLQGPRTVRVGHYHRGGDALKLRKPDAITPVRCLAYVLAQIGVVAAIPGCANVEELQAALAYEDAGVEERDFSQILTDFEQYRPGECTYCNHCLPCPANIDIGQTLRLLDLAQSGVTPALQAAYDSLPAPASDCIVCGACEARCPFDVTTVSRVQRAADVFSG
ncbi:MAG: aldo/keto reductase [Anaerolineae bacterium]